MVVCKTSHVQITWGKCMKTKDMFLHTTWGLGLPWTCMRHVQKKVTEVGRAWPRPLASVESWPCSHFPARLAAYYVSQKGFVDLYVVPPIPASRPTPRGHERKSLFLGTCPIRKWSTGSPPIIYWVILQDGFGISFMLQVPPSLPLQKWISISLVH